MLCVVPPPHTDPGPLGNLPLAQQQGCSAGEGVISKGTDGALSGMDGSVGRKRGNLSRGTRQVPATHKQKTSCHVDGQAVQQLAPGAGVAAAMGI